MPTDRTYHLSSCLLKITLPSLQRHMEDFVTWVDTSKLKRTIMRYNDEVSRFIRMTRGLKLTIFWLYQLDDFDLLWCFRTAGDHLVCKVSAGPCIATFRCLGRFFLYIFGVRVTLLSYSFGGTAEAYYSRCVNHSGRIKICFGWLPRRKIRTFGLLSRAHHLQMTLFVFFVLDLDERTIVNDREKRCELTEEVLGWDPGCAKTN